MSVFKNSWSKLFVYIIGVIVVLLVVGGTIQFFQNDNPKTSNSSQESITETDNGHSGTINLQTTETAEQIISRVKESEEYKNAQSIAYAELFRNSESYEGRYFKLAGQVIQLLGTPGNWQYRVNITKTGEEPYAFYEDTVYLESIDQERVIEGDIITFIGRHNGLITYESTLGANITVPHLKTVEHELIGRN